MDRIASLASTSSLTINIVTSATQTCKCLKKLKILHEFLFSCALNEEEEPAKRLTDMFMSVIYGYLACS